MSRITRFAVPTAAAVLALALSGCGGSSPVPADKAAESPAASAGQQAGAALNVTDTWAKAVPDVSTKKMTGVFGKITNTTDKPVTIVSGKNSVSEVTELHETIDKDGQKIMQKVEGGFTVEPGATRELKPGSDHVMIMNMTKPLNAGDEVTVTLTTQDGQDIEFTAVAKPFTGAAEPYATGGMSPAPSPSMSMSH